MIHNAPVILCFQQLQQMNMDFDAGSDEDSLQQNPDGELHISGVKKHVTHNIANIVKDKRPSTFNTPDLSLLNSLGFELLHCQQHLS